MKPSPSVTPDHARIVVDILRSHLPQESTVRMFGSRATGRARPYSDLDLAIHAGRRLTLDETAGLTEAFSESELPYRVDIIDWQALDDRFRRLIAGSRLPLLHLARPAAPGAG